MGARGWGSILTSLPATGDNKGNKCRSPPLLLSGVGFLGRPIVTFVGAGVVWSGVGTLASPWLEGGRLVGPGRGRRNSTRRPHPAQPFPRPYECEAASQATS